SLLSGSKTPLLFRCFLAIASASRGNHSGKALLAGIKSQTRTVLSNDTITMRLPSGLNCADHTESSCFIGSVRGLPVWASQTRAVLSPDAVTMRLPSGLNCAD